MFATNITQFPGAACDDKPVSVQPLAKTTDMESGSQFLWSGLDIDGDGKVAPGDVLGVFLHLLFLPGDFAIDLLIDLPVIARLLGIDANSYGGVASKTVSVLFWIATLILLGWIWSVIRDLDRAVTAGISSGRDEFVRRLRVTRRRFASWVGMKLQRHRVSGGGLDVGELQLEKLEAAVLSCFAGLSEDRKFAAMQVSETLNVSPAKARGALYTLVRYQFLQPMPDSHENNPTYEITRAGQIYLMER